jgi:uncharacterized protein YerC
MKPHLPLALFNKLSQGSQHIDTLDERSNSNSSAISKIKEVQKTQEGKITDLCRAIQCLYQYWECFQVFKTACVCEDFKQIAEQKPIPAYKKICAYYSKQNMECTISQEEVNGCITAAKILCRQGCD